MKIFLFLGLVIFNSAIAFTLNNNVNLAFAQNEVKVNIASGFCTNIGVSDADLLSIVDEAVDQYWNTAPTSRLKLRAGSLTSVSTNFKTALICSSTTNGCDPNTALAVSSDILISCNTNSSNFSNSTSVLAVTVPNNLDGSKIQGSLIILNDMSPNNKLATKSRTELVGIIAHELGHAIGLGHSPVNYALMYYAVVPNRVDLSQDDIDGISYLYPKQQPMTCGTVQDINNTQKKNMIITFLLGIVLSYGIISLKRKNGHV